MLISDPMSENLKKKATRDGYGDGLLVAGEKDNKVVVLDADLSGSTKTNGFKNKYPDRFINFGVAEQNMMGQAAGMALSGLKPVASSFAMFASGRAWEIVRNSIAYPKANVKICATHAGITLGEDGASHQVIEDIALMRVIPGMIVLVPADYWQAYYAIIAALEIDGPVYIRLGRPAVPMIYSQEDKFEIGKASVVQEGGDITFFACGVMVYEAWKAARILQVDTGKKINVIDVKSIKPLDETVILKYAEKSKHIFTFEEHNVLAGMGSAITELVSSKLLKKIIRIGIDDEFGQSGTISALMDHYELTAEKLTKKIKQYI